MGMSQSLTQRTGRSALWQIMGGGAMTIIRLGASFFLARALTPEDFGLIGMAVLLREFVFVMGSMDMGAGVIVKDDVSEDDLYTFFWSMAGLRSLMFLVAFFGAPLGVYVFNDPRVVDVLRVISFTFLMSIMAVTANALLAKQLKYFHMNIANVSTALIESSLAVVLVLNTELGYWALVIATLVQAFLYNASLFVLARWWPKFRFSKESFRYLFRFGINGLGFSVTNYLKQNLDYLLVGRILGTHALGLYEFAYRLPHLVNDRISRPVGSVIMPSMSYIKNDNPQMVQGYINVVKYVSMVTFPLLFGMAAVAEVAVPVLWGQQWISIVVPLQILCFCSVLRIVVQPVGAIFNCKNRPDLPFKISVVELFWTALMVGGFGYYFSVVGVAVGMLFSLFPSIISIYLAFKLMNGKILELYTSISTVFLSAFVCGISAYGSTKMFKYIGVDDLYSLLLSIVIGALFYLLSICIVFPRLRGDLYKMIGTVTGRKFGLKFT